MFLSVIFRHFSGHFVFSALHGFGYVKSQGVPFGLLSFARAARVFYAAFEQVLGRFQHFSASLGSF